MAVSAYKMKARVLLKIPLDQARRVVSPTIGVVELQRCGTLLRIGADDPRWIAGHLAGLGCAFRILDPPELKQAVADLGARLIKNSV